MKTTKSIHELLILLKKQYTQDVKEKTNSGLCQLCGYNRMLLDKNKITNEESVKLSDYIHSNRPKQRANSKYKINDLGSAFFWPSLLIQPRLNWLTYHIKKNKSKGLYIGDRETNINGLNN